MSKSMFNVVNPDMIVEKYGADTLRMYEMFLGPVEQSKPWDTNGIDGVHRFIRKFWSLFYDRTGNYLVTVLLQYKHQCFYDLRKRAVRAEMQQERDIESAYRYVGSFRSARM